MRGRRGARADRTAIAGLPPASASSPEVLLRSGVGNVSERRGACSTQPPTTLGRFEAADGVMGAFTRPTSGAEVLSKFATDFCASPASLPSGTSVVCREHALGVRRSELRWSERGDRHRHALRPAQRRAADARKEVPDVDRCEPTAERPSRANPARPGADPPRRVGRCNADLPKE